MRYYGQKFFWVIVLFLGCKVHAQTKYWITFTDKPNATGAVLVSPQAVQNRQAQGLPVSQPTDAPVSNSYLSALQNLGVQPQVVSKWLNATSAYLTEAQVQAVRRLPFVQQIDAMDSRIRISSLGDTRVTPEVYTTVLNQIGAKALTDEGLTGKGIKVGIIDVGFYGAATNASLQHVRDEKRIKDTKDFVNPDRLDSFFNMETHSDYHGAEVMQLIGGYNETQKMEFGMATGATFYLARTDHGVRETRAEEDNWIAAVERMDSLGVRLINTSLGYATGFSNSKENYKPAEMDGKTSKISRAAQIAADQKGILIVVSAGNEGDDIGWRIISTPADAQGVLSIGATKAKSRDRISYSSIGPDFLPYLKPNVSCFSPNGTSFSAPVITGLAACLMEKNPKLTNKQLMHIIEKSAHLYPYGNNFIGYGVPDARKALQLVQDSTLTVNTVKAIHTKHHTYELTVSETEAERAVVFHKKNNHLVLKQEVLAPVNGKLALRRQSDEKRTTVDLGNEVVEIFWDEK
jgi:subtilisin family serine protease